MKQQNLLTRRHGTVAISGTSLTVAIRQELLDMKLDSGDNVAITLLEDDETKEKSILIERLNHRG